MILYKKLVKDVLDNYIKSRINNYKYIQHWKYKLFIIKIVIRNNKKKDHCYKDNFKY